tara:strand:- start:144 stop:440 length:297 start_codon:yes stop_codon:yes gene_type:complete
MFLHPDIGLIFLSEEKYHSLAPGEGFPLMRWGVMQQIHQFVVVEGKNPKLFPMYDLTGVPEPREALAWIINNYEDHMSRDEAPEDTGKDGWRTESPYC